MRLTHGSWSGDIETSGWVHEALTTGVPSQSTKRKKACCDLVVVQGRDALYWHQVSVTLCNENETLRRELDIKSDSYRALQESHVRLSTSYRHLNETVVAVIRNNAILRNRAVPGKRLTPVPSNTQGKDVMFWHQCARTLQKQYLQVCVQLEQVCAGLSDEGNSF